jgi:uncharacterized RmlC-like cupin family protein
VIGCTLAEFATVSTDMVDRLHDQNEKRPVPAEFTRPLTEGRLRGLAWPDVSHRVITGPGGTTEYSRRAIPSETVTGGIRTVLDEGVVSACTYRLDAGAASGISVDRVRATSLHVVRGSGRLVLGEASEVARPSPPTLAARAGDLFFVAPGAYYGFINDDGEPLTVAEHRIPADVAFV